jgi:Flp pilus assembly protein TadD
MLTIKNRVRAGRKSEVRSPKSEVKAARSAVWRLQRIVSGLGSGFGLASELAERLGWASTLLVLPASVVLLNGCAPPGPRALLQGQRLVERGDFARAAEKLRTATSLLATNAQAWNYLGIACQHLGERDEAVRAYQHALSLNHDLSEAHYNLGCLWLEQNKLDAARTEFTTFTLRRGNSLDGFLKLATVQARARDFTAAEKSYGDVLRLSPQNPEALNGLGMVRLQQNRLAEAERCFAAALKQQHDYRPALLNSAIVAHEYTHDLRTALTRYRQYLALKPSPPNADAVAAVIRELEQTLNPPQRPGLVAKATPPTITNPSVSKPATGAATRAVPAQKADVLTNVPRSAPATNPPRLAPALTAPPSQAPQVVKLGPEPTVKTAQDLTSKPTTPPHTAPEPVVTTTSAPVTVVEPTAPKRGFFDRVNPVNVFRSDSKTAPRTTPLPPSKQATAPAQPETLAAAASVAPAGSPSRYNYRSPAAPAPGNRAEAQRYFDQGLEAQRAHRLNDALQAYREATQLDPSFFEAQFYLAFAATQAGDLPTALTRYEYALALSPNDPSARYNFALVLKQANCIGDAVNELERLLSIHPNEARAHLALANIYTQQLHRPAEARPHYVRALELDPGSPQAGDIRNWLRDHPQ